MAKKTKRGPSTPFGPKHWPNKSFTLTKFAKEQIRQAAARSDESESNVVELLARQHAKEINKDSFAELKP